MVSIPTEEEEEEEEDDDNVVEAVDPCDTMVMERLGSEIMCCIDRSLLLLWVLGLVVVTV